MGASSAEPLTDDALRALHEQFLAQQAWALGSPEEGDVDSMLQHMLDRSAHAAPARAGGVVTGDVHTPEDGEDGEEEDEREEEKGENRPAVVAPVVPRGFAALVHDGSAVPLQDTPAVLPSMDDAALDAFVAGLAASTDDAAIDQLLAGVVPTCIDTTASSGLHDPHHDTLGDVDELLATLPPAPVRRLPVGVSAAAAPALADLEADRAMQRLVDAAEDDMGGLTETLTGTLTEGLGSPLSPPVLGSPGTSPDTAAQLLEDMSAVLLDVQQATGRADSADSAPAWHPPRGWQPGMREVRGNFKYKCCALWRGVQRCGTEMINNTQVYIPSTHVAQGPKDSHTRYVVHVALDDGRSYQRAHRFRDFVQLLAALKAAGVAFVPAWADVTKARAVTGASRYVTHCVCVCA